MLVIRKVLVKMFGWKPVVKKTHIFECYEAGSHNGFSLCGIYVSDKDSLSEKDAKELTGKEASTCKKCEKILEKRLKDEKKQ